MRTGETLTLSPFRLLTRSRSGQVALYLIAVLVAICVLMIMNVSVYLSVSAKNRVMNAGDAAALAVANYQGELLNRIGQMNLDHLRAALENDADACEQITMKQIRCCFLGPISGIDGGNMSFPYGGISAGNEAAKKNGSKRNEDVEDLLRKHVLDVRTYYAPNPEVYPEPWEGAWDEYALALELAINAGIWAGPDNITFLNAAGGHTLLDPQFYNAIAGRTWCWFKFNNPGLLGSYGGFTNWGPLPVADDETRWRRHVNSEVYSLHLQWRVGSAVQLLGKDLIRRLLNVTAGELSKSKLLNDPLQSWMFYDDSIWRDWWEINPDGEHPFPVVGPIRPEYDVRGCAALCRVYDKCADLWDDNRVNSFSWVGGAKPFGTVENAEGKVSIVTANSGFVTPAFERSNLVPIDTVVDCDLSTADPDWMRHVEEHLPIYLQNGPTAVAMKNCWYCRQLVTWERYSFRQRGVRWLKHHSEDCERPVSVIYWTRGGTPHAH